eukprot:TRINITY_DN601_c0_g1_i1.p5 TRINITY_DN601_c0_g1~~TRINITY_DN601_c0_g1_i1.p5  ORF type:complete len:215 (-),score=71.98 TRINITY_DN601_c0_g1_i1:18-662(-)
MFWNMIFYFRLVTQPTFILDLNYKGPMMDVLKLIRKQASLPSKQSNAKIVLESNKSRVSTRIPSGAYSVHGESDKNSVGISEPGKGNGSRKGGSSVTSGGEQEKIPGSIANSHVVKHFGPLFEEYRRLKGEMKFALLGPAVHIPFGQAPVMKGEAKNPTPGSRKAVDIGGPNLKLGALELKTNDFANSIIDLSLIHICRCRRLLTCRSRWSPYH